ncbi:MAG: ABC transporter ATP-binding protein [Ilumatobacter sp.]|uniref:ABC transporter ATP-binding protein n=1 Tax=Ilumatobacter sp. TaxID=1967498 RepID=UPI00261644E6|nr:ABC transporter ATP-binding protein [Ilumatobacter sp.]MDJ0767928.1 ABC transporter ATP-binding protein [Ilumatobacter sp.]
MTWCAADVSVSFGRTVALDAVSIAIEPGAIHAVIGGDGAGKSTLLKVVAGLDVGQAGSFDLPPSHRVGFVPSSGGYFGDLTVDENIDFVARAYRLSTWRDRANALLHSADLHPFGDRLAGRMSGGQRRKLAGCMALLHDPDLLVLDEVTTGVDPLSRLELWRLIAASAADGAAVVAATTYLDEAERTSSATLLREGRVIAAGPPDEIIAGVSGGVDDVDVPSDRSLAWRKGRRWRQWSPAGERTGAISLEDAAIVYELMASRDVA